MKIHIFRVQGSFSHPTSVTTCSGQLSRKVPRSASFPRPFQPRLDAASGKSVSPQVFFRPMTTRKNARNRDFLLGLSLHDEDLSADSGGKRTSTFVDALPILFHPLFSRALGPISTPFSDFLRFFSYFTSICFPLSYSSK